jgi:tRNA(Arg) A34 adenosine deaminase TadA
LVLFFKKERLSFFRRLSLPEDLSLLRRAITLAEDAAALGRRPFGAVVARADGTIIAEAGSVAADEVRDWTAHSEMQALRAASAALSWDELADCTLYASSEPCPMCAAALFWCNLSRLMFSAPESEVRDLRKPFARAAGLEMSARDVLAAAPRPIEVLGPVIPEEGLAAHRRFWGSAKPDV